MLALCKDYESKVQYLGDCTPYLLRRSGVDELFIYAADSA